MSRAKNSTKNSTGKIAIVGVFSALSIVLLFLAGIIPGIELTFFAVCGILVSLVINESGIKGGLFLVVVSLLLGLLIVPNKLALLPYAFFFGPYGILRKLFERVDNIASQYILKLIAFNILIAAGLLIFQEAFLSGIELPDLAWPLLIIGAEVMFVVYDTILKLAERVFAQMRRKV